MTHLRAVWLLLEPAGAAEAQACRWLKCEEATKCAPAHLCLIGLAHGGGGTDPDAGLQSNTFVGTEAACISSVPANGSRQHSSASVSTT